MFRITTRPKNSLMSINQSNSKLNFSGEQKADSPANKTSKFWLLGAFGSAVAATFCCLPALLFLLFGSSFGLLSVLAPFEPYRPILTLVALVFFAVFVWARFFRKSCSLSARVSKRQVVLLIVAFFALLVLLFYPEILGVLYNYV